VRVEPIFIPNEAAMAQSRRKNIPTVPTNDKALARLAALTCLCSAEQRARLHRHAIASGESIYDFVHDAVELALDEAERIGLPQGDRPFDEIVAASEPAPPPRGCELAS
jgi:hypothetical protein